jgi:hypothetical protein
MGRVAECTRVNRAVQAARYVDVVTQDGRVARLVAGILLEDGRGVGEVVIEPGLNTITRKQRTP